MTKSGGWQSGWEGEDYLVPYSHTIFALSKMEATEK